jgi:hypothetical protein
MPCTSQMRSVAVHCLLSPTHQRVRCSCQSCVSHSRVSYSRGRAERRLGSAASSRGALLSYAPCTAQLVLTASSHVTFTRERKSERNRERGERERERERGGGGERGRGGGACMSGGVRQPPGGAPFQTPPAQQLLVTHRTQLESSQLVTQHVTPST